MILGAFGSGRASKIDENLWQGGYPISGFSKIDVIVLAARDLQPDVNIFPANIEVILAPMDDFEDGPSVEDQRTAFRAAQAVADRLERGKRVLVTCVAGRNRSGLINALVLVFKYGISGREAVARIQAIRPLALSNPSFVAFLNRIPAKT